MIARSVFNCDDIGVGVMLNHPDPAVLSCCFLRFLRKDDEKDVGIFLTLPPLVLFCIASDDGVFTFFDAVAGSNVVVVSDDLFNMDIDGVVDELPLCDARLRSSDKLAPLIPCNDFASRRIGAV